MLIGIQCAMACELEGILSGLTVNKTACHAGIPFYEGTYRGRLPVVAAISGVGKVYAAMCAELMILKYAPDLILNVGVAGALQPEYNDILSAVIGVSAVQYDLDTSAAGDPPGMVSGIRQVYFPCDGNAVAAAERAAQALCCPYTKGVIATGDQFSSRRDNCREIVTLFHALAREMESAAIAQVCAANAAPFACIKVISDICGTRAPQEYDANKNQAAGRAAALTLKFLELIEPS